jgi:hypothetical protein
MPDSSAWRSSRRPRLKLLLAAALAAASVSLPLTPVWRATGAEIEALAAERALLDPLARAQALQRSLLGHADVAARVLRGRGALEGERKLRQHGVDADLVALQATLSAGLWTRALGESHGLAQDWRALAWAVAQRSIGTAGSWDAHQLLVEQTVLVMDIVTASAQPPDATLLRLALQPTSRSGEAETALLARVDAIDTRLAAAHEARASALAAAAAAALLLFGLITAAARVAPRSPPAAPGDDMRRSPGRRSTDHSGFDPALHPSLGAAALAARRQTHSGSRD